MGFGSKYLRLTYRGDDDLILRFLKSIKGMLYIGPNNKRVDWLEDDDFNILVNYNTLIKQITKEKFEMLKYATKYNL